MPWIPNRVLQFVLPAANSCIDSCSLSAWNIRRNLHFGSSSSIHPFREFLFMERELRENTCDGGSALQPDVEQHKQSNCFQALDIDSVTEWLR